MMTADDEKKKDQKRKTGNGGMKWRKRKTKEK